MIIDEPQNMETDIRRHAIASLNPLFTLRYSATHKNAYNPIFRLNPVQAYELGLVKQIEVDSVLADNDVNGAYVALKEINAGAKPWSAKVEILVNDKSMKKKIVTIKQNQNLFDLSKQNEAYRTGYILDGMNVEEQQIQFSGGLKVTKGVDNSLLKDDIQKMQIRRTIEEHLRKEKILNPLGIKVLSLFFIDKVDNYRNDGKFYQWFEDIYRELTHGKDPVGVHEGYFSKDKKGVLKDTNGTTQADNDTYHLIMRDKETLLSLDKPLRFIFSHSVLREGWDNPNVFQICTLNDTHSEIKKRQEIGRGLRLPVNQFGVRSHERDKNILTVIANESYEEFATKLQREIEEDCGVSFDKGQIKNKLDRKYVRYRKDFSQHPEFAAIWERIKHQTTYRVNFSQDELIESAVKNLVKMPRIDEVKIRHEKVAFAINEKGVTTEYRSSNQVTSKTHWDIPDVLGELQKKTGLTRQTICRILQKSKRLAEIYHNPQRFMIWLQKN